MTKHLRLIMLSLLAMICMGGYSAVGDTYKLVTSVDELHDGDLIVIANSDNQKAMGMQNKNNRASVAISFTDDTRESFNLVAKVAVLTLSKSGDKWKFKSTNGYLYSPVNSTKNYLKSSTDGNIDGSLATITITNKNATIQFDSKNSNIIRYNSAVDQQTFSCYPSDNKQKDVQIYKKQGSGLTSTSTTFGTNYDGKTFDFVNGVLEGWKAPTATHTPADVAGTTAYKSDNEAVATVDAKGQLTFKGYGTAKITATFTPTETKTYAASSASYTVINKDPNAVDVDVVFVAGVDKESDKTITKEGITISTSNGKLYKYTEYRLYSGSTTTISVKTGKIVKIEFVGVDTENKVSNLSLTQGEPGTFNAAADGLKATWTGSASSIKFKTNAQARVTKITITVVGAIFLNENGDNIVKTAENVNVTLKRTFFHDNAWNTLCLPFDVDANKVATAFAGAEIREIDPNKCTANTIQFVPATEIKAGVPYIIKWNENVAEAKPFEKTFEGVTLIAEPKPVKVNNDITFTGFYNKTTADKLGESVAAIGAENKLFKVTSSEMKGFRAAFVLNSNAQPSAIKLVIDGTATGIEDLVIDGVKANGRVYNLNGQYVGNSLNGLQPGLYIQNGKKIVVK